MRYEIDKRPEVTAEHQRCVRALKEFAQQYVDKWESIQGDRAKAEGWAILQAAVSLERSYPMVTIYDDGQG